MIKRLAVMVAVFVLGLLVLGLAPTQATPPPPVPPIPEIPQRVRVECNAGEPTCRFEIQIPGGNNIDVEVRRVGAIPTRPPRIIRVPGPVRTIVRTVRPPRRTIIRTAPPETIFRTRTRTRTRTVTPPPAPPRTVVPPPVTVTEGPPAVIRPRRPNATVMVTPEIPQSTSDELRGSHEGPSPTRQPRPTRDTLTPTSPPDVVFPRVELSYESAAIFSLVGLAILLAIVVAALVAGYYLGWDEEKRKNKRFHETLRDELFKAKRR